MSAASASAPAAARLEVEVDPVMRDSIADQKEHAEGIAQLRAAVADDIAASPNADLAKEFATSDRVVFRFLKARKYDIEKAAALFREALVVREKHGLDHILEKPCKLGLEYKIVGKHGWCGYDRCGRPIFVENIGLQNYQALSSVGDVQDRVNYNMYTNEYVRKVMMPAANARINTEKLGYEIDQMVIIVNLKDFGWHCIKKHNYDWVQGIAAVNNVIFPETAGVTVIINAPYVFKMVWNIVSGWIDERTKAKIQILSSDGKQELIQALGEEAYYNLPAEIFKDARGNYSRGDEEVPAHGMASMLQHPMSVAFIEHLVRRNNEAGIPNVYKPAAAVSNEVHDTPAHEEKQAGGPEFHHE